MLDRTGIEFSQAIPGILNLTDIDGLLGLIAPRRLLLLSATEDRQSPPGRYYRRGYRARRPGEH
jgi:hypothetical protein